MAVQASLAADTSPSPRSTVARAVVLLTAITGVLLTAFAWPSVRSSVHDVPIAVAGPAAAVERSTVFFEGHGATRPAVVLAIWLALGLLPCLAGTLRARRTATVAAGLSEDARITGFAYASATRRS